MILSEWPSTVNTKFFAFSSKPKANTEEVEYISGRVVSWRKNTRATKEIECKLMLKIDSELSNFWAWFNDILGQTAGAFTCDALGEGYYRFREVPSPDDTDQANRVLNLSIEEV